MEELKYIGQSITRIDGKEKVSGAAVFADDIDFGTTLLFAQIVESTKAHALIINIDTSEAEKIEGVVAVFTGKDFPFKFGLYMKDRFVFAQDKVRFIGEQIAAVIARDAKTAKRAAKLIKVEYKELPEVIFDVEPFAIYLPAFIPKAEL